jgi:hypothetical protein
MNQRNRQVTSLFAKLEVTRESGPLIPDISQQSGRPFRVV